MTEDRNRRRLIVFSQLTLAGYWIVLFTATHMPPSAAPMPGQFADKIVHAAAYAVLAVLLATVWQLAGGHLTWRHLKWVWLVVTLYGIIDELTQPMVGREASLLDWLADAAGSALGIGAFVWARARLARLSKPDQ